MQCKIFQMSSSVAGKFWVRIFHTEVSLRESSEPLLSNLKDTRMVSPVQHPSLNKCMTHMHIIHTLDAWIGKKMVFRGDTLAQESRMQVHMFLQQWSKGGFWRPHQSSSQAKLPLTTGWQNCDGESRMRLKVLSTPIFERVCRTFPAETSHQAVPEVPLRSPVEVNTSLCWS